MILDFGKEITKIIEALGLDQDHVTRRQSMAVAVILVGVLDRGISQERQRCLGIVARKAMNAAAVREEINRPLR